MSENVLVLNTGVAQSIPVTITNANQIYQIAGVYTQTSHTVSNADTDITTYALAANTYTSIRVRVTGYVQCAAASTAQLISLKIKDTAAQEGQTYKVGSIAVATDAFPFTLCAGWVEQSAVTIHFTQAAAGADANTTVFINSIEVEGIV